MPGRRGGRVRSAADPGAAVVAHTPMGALGQASGQELVDASCSVLPRSTAAMAKRARSVHRFVEYLQGFPGHSWQQRWLASGGDTAAASLARLNPAVDSWSMTRGFSWLAAMRVVAPSVAALRSSSVADYFTVFSACQHDELLARLQKAVNAAPASPIYRYRACNELAYALTSQAITLAELTPSGFLQFGVEYRAASRTREDRYPGTLLWPVLADGGYFPPRTPATLRAATSGSRRSIVELVDRYDVREKAVRELLVDYISHRAAAGMDASTTSSLVRTLVRNFWCVIERVNPDQRDLAVNEATYLAWRREVDVVIDHNGMARPRQSIWDLLIAVRALYLDLQSWAVEDPARWARWWRPAPSRRWHPAATPLGVEN